ncbi:MAG: HNH endonuclease [Lacibacter sp.]
MTKQENTFWQNELERYRQLLLHPLWLQRRNAILQRDSYRCRNCGATSQLQVHHRQYHVYRHNNFRKEPWAYADHLLITLCRSCHENGHRRHVVPVFKVD